MSWLRTVGRLLLHRTLALALAAVVIVLAALLVPQAQSLWFQMLRADADVTTMALFPTPTASPTASPAATGTPTTTATPTATPVLLAEPDPESCVDEGSTVTFGSSPKIEGPAPFAAAFDVVNTSPATAAGVLLGLRVSDGAAYAQRVDYGNGQYWLLDGRPDAGNLYLVGDVAPGDTLAVRLTLATSPEWEAAPQDARVSIDVVLTAACPVELGAVTTLVFERPAPAAPTVPPEPEETPEPDATDTPEPPPTETSAPPALSAPEISVPAEPTFAPIGDPAGEDGTATPPAPAPTATEAPPPTARPQPTATRTPRPAHTAVPQPTSTPVPVVVPTTPPPPPVGAAEPAAADLVQSERPVVDLGAEAPETPIAETMPSPKATATVARSAPNRTPPVGQVLANGDAPKARATQQPKTGYEWIGEAGAGTLAALIACAALGFVVVAAGIGRRYG